MKKHKNPTLADSICDLRVRKIKKQFFTQINTLLDWGSISKIIDQHYKKRVLVDTSVVYTPLKLREKQLIK